MPYEENFSDEEADFEDEESVRAGTYVFKCSYVIVAIDTHPSMFVRDENGCLPFRNCLESCLRILESLIFVKDSKRWNPFAVLLKRENEKLIDFGDNIIDSIKMLKSKLKLSDEELEDEFQAKTDSDLAEFLLQCKKAFYNIEAAYHKRILVYITNDARPAKDEQSKFAAINEVKSFDACDISLEIVPTDADFNFNLLYNEMLSVLESSSERKEEICTDVDGLEQKLSSVLLPKHNKTKVRFYPFKDDLKRYIMCFNVKMTKSQRLLNTKVTVEGKSVKSKPTPLTEDLPNFKIKTAKNFTPDVVFDLEENNKLYDVSYPTGYTLLYIGKTMVDRMYNVSKPNLLQRHFTEKTNFFEKFWQYCFDNDSVLVCVKKTKQPGKIKFFQFSPVMVGDFPNFLCKEIPYGNNVNIPPAPVETADETAPSTELDENDELVRKLVDRLTIDFHPDMIPDPKYRKKTQYVKSKLLDEPYENDVQLFDKSTLDRRIREEAESVKNAFGFFGIDKSSAKRKRPTTASAASRKKKN